MSFDYQLSLSKFNRIPAGPQPCVIVLNSRLTEEHFEGAWIDSSETRQHQNLYPAECLLNLEAFFTLVNLLSARIEVEETVDQLGLRIDAKEWPELEEVLAESVELDYRSLFGGTVETLSRAEVITRWKNLLALIRTQHIITNLHIAIKPDNTAECTGNVLATHVRSSGGEDSMWTVGGRYDFHLAQENGRWRIYAIKLTAIWTTGNPNILNQTY